MEESRLRFSVGVSGKSLSSVDVKLQRTSMSSEVKGNAPDRPWVSYDSQIQKCRVKLGDVDEGLSGAVFDK